MNQPSNPELWKKHAGSFVVRTRGQLWGKHNETALVWLYEKGFTVKYAQAMFFGFNRRYTSRRPENWGIVYERPDEKLVLPPGIVIPYIVDQALKKITIIHLDDYRVLEIMPDKDACPDTVLKNNNSRLVIIDDPLQGYLFHQQAGNDYDILIPAVSGCGLFINGRYLIDSYTHIYYAPAIAGSIAASVISENIASETAPYSILPPGAAARNIAQWLADSDGHPL